MKTMNANLETKEKTECSWSCPECGGTTYYVTDALRRVCGACGLEDETATDMYVSQPMKDTDARKRVQSSPVYDGKFITLIKGGVEFKNDERVARLITMHRRENWKHSRINNVDIENKAILKKLVDELQIDEKTASRSAELLDKIAGKKEIGTQARKTIRGRNIIFVASIVYVVDKINNIDGKYSSKLMEIIARDSEIVKPASKLNTFRYQIIDEFNLREDEKMSVFFYMKKHGIDRYHSKIHQLITLLDAPHLKIEWLTIAAAKYVYTYYNRGASISMANETVKRYAEFISTKTGMILGDSTVGNVFKKRPGIVISEENEFYEVFNDEFDLVIEGTLHFLDEIGRESARDVAEVIKLGTISRQYLERDQKYRGIANMIINAPFVKNDGEKITYIAADDIRREIEDFARKRETRQSIETDRFFIGTRLKNRDTIDKRSFNVLTSKKDGRFYIKWNNAYNIDAEDMMKFIEIVTRHDSMLVTDMFVTMESTFVFSNGKKIVPRQHGNKMFQYFDFLYRNGFMKEVKKETNSKIVVIGTVDKIVEKIDSIKRDVKPYLHWMSIQDAKAVIAVVYDGFTSPRDAQTRMIETGMLGEDSNPYKIYNVFKFLVTMGLIEKNKISYILKSTIKDAYDAIEGLEIWDKEKIESML